MAGIWYLGLALVAIHLAVPLLYYLYLGLHKTYDSGPRRERAFTPEVAIVIPTYNEASTIRRRLENIKSQTYPPEKMRIVIVDSASTDETVRIAEDWASENKEFSLQTMSQQRKEGMVPALNFALEQMPHSSEVLVFTDADCIWSTDSLENGVQHLSEPGVGLVTGCIFPEGHWSGGSEHSYRELTNRLRVLESQYWSTPVAHGPFLAISQSLLRKVGGFPIWSGANDSPVASLVGFLGYRAIAVPDVEVFEPQLRFPKSLLRKLRRGQHLILNFRKARREVKSHFRSVPSPFGGIFAVEKFLHVVNPWMLLTGVILLLIGMPTQFQLGFLALGGVFLGLSYKARAWVGSQGILLVAFVKSLYTNTYSWIPLR